MIVKSQIINDYKVVKIKAINYFESNKFEKCLATIEAAAHLAYSFNLFYLDEELEEIIKKIGEKYFHQSDVKNHSGIVFYDSFGYDNRGLTQQYIRAMISHNLYFIYILGSDKSLHMSKDILDELNAYKNVEIYIIPEKLSRLEKISFLGNLINKLGPTKILTHRTPWDCIGQAVFSNVKNSERFHVNLTDHAFWLGRNAADYFIEFRSYGANISKKERKIDSSRLLLLPYYPIVTDSSFQGFPEFGKDNVILFTGASYYKMYGEKGKFFDLVKQILEKNSKTILLIAGNGNDKPINDFINANNFQDRIFLLGDRRDINKVFKNIDIYIATYPITGGLMAQYSALNSKPIVAFTDPELSCNIVEEFVKTDDYQITYFNEIEFVKEVSHLIQDPIYRKSVSEKIKGGVVDIDKFNSNFLSVVYEKQIIEEFQIYDVNINRFADIYIEAENNYLHSYTALIFRYFKAAGKDIEMRYYPSLLKHILRRSFKKVLKF